MCVCVRVRLHANVRVRAHGRACVIARNRMNNSQTRTNREQPEISSHQRG